MPYLFAHFREKITVDGEQVYFSVSKNGFDWEKVNDGKPVIICDKGCGGCRDIEVVRLKTGGFVVIATDLCIVKHMDENYNVDWGHINSHGSRFLSLWRSDDLVNFSEQELIYLGRDDFGCLWAPEVFYDEEREEYLLHWSSTVSSDNYAYTLIYASTTRDFVTFSKPVLFFEKDRGCFDSHIVKYGDTYHLFYKNVEPGMNLHATSKSLYGPYENDGDFEEYMKSLEKPGAYEAVTTYDLPDGRWCMMMDFFGCEKDKMGYVPFVSEKGGDAHFKRADGEFSFPYGFKHGGVIEITGEEYERLLKIKRQ